MIKKDQRLNHVNRIWELDFIRGICISAKFRTYVLFCVPFRIGEIYAKEN